MKLKEGFVIQDLGNEMVAAAAGEAGRNFHGIVRGNKTAGFVFRALTRETSETEITHKLTQVYDVPEEKAAADVKKIVSQLRSAGLLDE